MSSGGSAFSGRSCWTNGMFGLFGSVARDYFMSRTHFQFQAFSRRLLPSFTFLGCGNDASPKDPKPLGQVAVSGRNLARAVAGYSPPLSGFLHLYHGSVRCTTSTLLKKIRFSCKLSSSTDHNSRHACAVTRSVIATDAAGWWEGRACHFSPLTLWNSR